MVSIQFGNTGRETLFSFAVPSSTSAKNAIFDLADRSRKPCTGLELFFSKESLLTLLAKLQREKTSHQPTQSVTTQAVKPDIPSSAP